MKGRAWIVVAASVMAVVVLAPPGTASLPASCEVVSDAAADAVPGSADLTKVQVGFTGSAEYPTISAAIVVADLPAAPAAAVPPGARSATWEVRWRNEDATSASRTGANPFLALTVEALTGTMLWEYGGYQEGIRQALTGAGTWVPGTPGEIRFDLPANNQSMVVGHLLRSFAASVTATTGLPAIVDRAPDGGTGSEQIVVGLGNTCLPNEWPVETAPLRARDFVDSIGVNTHFGFNPSPYRSPYPNAGDGEVLPENEYWPRVAAILQDLGIRHIRDQLTISDDPHHQTYIPWFQTLHSTYGMSIDVTAPPYLGGDPVDVAKVIGVLEQLVPAVESIEGQNEPDNPVGVPGYPDSIVDYQRRLFTAVKANPATAGLTVLAPALTSPQAYQAFPNIDQHADAGNLHKYALTEPYTWRKHGAPGRADAEHVVSPSKSVWLSETGWTNLSPDNSGLFSVSERAEAAYRTKSFLTNFAKGIPRTYQYELIDEAPYFASDNGDFGMVNRDFTPEQSFHAIKNLIGLIDEPAASFTPTTLAYTLSGGEGLRKLLLQKSDGTWWLALWTDDQLYTSEPVNNEGRVGPGDLFPAPTTATIGLPSARDITTYNPVASARSLGTAASATSMSLSIPADGVLLVEIAAPSAALDAVVPEAPAAVLLPIAAFAVVASRELKRRSSRA